jgi:putative hydrolase of the HAD superfamily
LQTALIPNAKYILKYLIKNYSLYIITNGFMDVQLAKIKNSGLSGYFKKIFTSEHARSSKPNRGIFEYALKSVNARKKESLMIGDDLEIDIKGAREFGIDQVYFNPSGIRHNDRLTYEIHSLLELKDLL